MKPRKFDLTPPGCHSKQSAAGEMGNQCRRNNKTKNRKICRPILLSAAVEPGQRAFA
jgi:hypothetical protein